MGKLQGNSYLIDTDLRCNKRVHSATKALAGQPGLPHIGRSTQNYICVIYSWTAEGKSPWMLQCTLFSASINYVGCLAAPAAKEKVSWLAHCPGEPGERL